MYRNPRTLVLRRSPASALVLALVLAAAPGVLPRAGAQDTPAGQARDSSRVQDLVIRAPRLTRRCRTLEVTARPADLARLEALVMAWIATCVTSRTHQAHREVALVRDNPSLGALFAVWPADLARTHILAEYTFDGERVTAVSFRSPDLPRAPPAAHAHNRDAAPTAPGVGGRAGAQSAHAAATRLPGDARPEDREPAEPVADLLLPDDGQDIVLDVLDLVEHMRRQGKSRDADELEALARKTRTLLTSLAILMGAYYVGTKYRAGKLLFLWGSAASGPAFQRALGRMSQLLPQVERALDTLVTAAKPHVTGAGAGIDWRVIDEQVNANVPAQMDGAACGPACAEMVLRDRGIVVEQKILVEKARTGQHQEIKSKFVNGRTMLRVLQEQDPQGGWTGGALTDEFVDSMAPRQLLEKLGAKGSWLAQVGKHFVVVDRYDRKTDHLFIRDPWYGPARERGIEGGTHYRVTARTFFEHWIAVAVYRE